MHRLDDPRPFAHLTYRAEVIGRYAIFARLADPSTGLDYIRSTALLSEAPGVDLPEQPPETPGTATVTQFAPERITIDVDTPAPAILTLALPAYPGWRAAIDGKTRLCCAYGGLSAIALPDEGTHTITLEYRPLTFTVGAVISIGTLVVLAAALVMKQR